MIIGWTQGLAAGGCIACLAESGPRGHVSYQPLRLLHASRATQVQRDADLTRLVIEVNGEAVCAVDRCLGDISQGSIHFSGG